MADGGCEIDNNSCACPLKVEVDAEAFVSCKIIYFIFYYCQLEAFVFFCYSWEKFLIYKPVFRMMLTKFYKSILVLSL